MVKAVAALTTGHGSRTKQDKRDHEEQMIPPEQDVLSPDDEVVAQHTERGRFSQYRCARSF